MLFLFAGHSDKPLKSLISMAHKGNHICLYRFSFHKPIKSRLVRGSLYMPNQRCKLSNLQFPVNRNIHGNKAGQSPDQV